MKINRRKFIQGSLSALALSSAFPLSGGEKLSDTSEPIDLYDPPHYETVMDPKYVPSKSDYFEREGSADASETETNMKKPMVQIFHPDVPDSAYASIFDPSHLGTDKDLKYFGERIRRNGKIVSGDGQMDFDINMAEKTLRANGKISRVYITEVAMDNELGELLRTGKIKPCSIKVYQILSDISRGNVLHDYQRKGFADKIIPLEEEARTLRPENIGDYIKQSEEQHKEISKRLNNGNYTDSSEAIERRIQEIKEHIATRKPEMRLFLEKTKFGYKFTKTIKIQIKDEAELKERAERLKEDFEKIKSNGYAWGIEAFYNISRRMPLPLFGIMKPGEKRR